MAIGDIIVGIDIGTSKVCTVVGEVNNFGQIETLCSTSCKCNGIKKGKIINEEEVSLSIAKTIKDAEEEAEFKINSAYVTIPGKEVTIVQNSIVKELKDKFAGISLKDVQSAIVQAKDIEIPEGYYERITEHNCQNGETIGDNLLMVFDMHIENISGKTIPLYRGQSQNHIDVLCKEVLFCQIYFQCAYQIPSADCPL